ncbi:DgyrCDS10849 [Dimorphilus gyrociliatus]|uniref:DgyrCDS10849 n=1 Tax=Dimorphilus gyrociliatus TaxID=2664684 RepID=A0A7I8W2M6_9ANNE|nr:DgyrCDS10849 [Dimorphilus gyrociliatus]
MSYCVQGLLYRISIYVILFHILLKRVVCEDCILRSIYQDNKGVKWTFEECLQYSEKFNTPPAYETTVYHPLVQLSDDNFCNRNKTYTFPKDSILIIGGGNCTYTDKAILAKKNGASAIVIVDSIISFSRNITGDGRRAYITVAVGNSKINESLQAIGTNITAKLYLKPHRLSLDPATFLLAMLAVFILAASSVWSASLKFQLYKADKLTATSSETNDDRNADCQKRVRYKSWHYESSGDQINITMVLGYVLCLVITLLLLYFFIRYLVYLVIAFYALGVTCSLYYVTTYLVQKFKFNTDKYEFNIKCRSRSKNVNIVDIIILILCIGVSIFWVVFRNERWMAWPMNVLSAILCMVFLRTFHLPNFKSGESVMSSVATASGSGERMPFVFSMYRIVRTPYDVCKKRGYTILGFGDVLIPAYTVGLVLCDVALYFMEKGQPALLYICPVLIFVNLGLASVRSELKEFWSFTMKPSQVAATHKNNEVVQSTTNNINNLNEDERMALVKNEDDNGALSPTSPVRN